MVIELDIISRFRSNLGFDSRIQIIYEYNYIQFIRPGPIPMILPKSFSLLQACCMALFLFISTFASKTIMIVLDTARNLIYKIYLLNFYLHFQSILIVTSKAQLRRSWFLFFLDGDGRDAGQQYWAYQRNYGNLLDTLMGLAQVICYMP